MAGSDGKAYFISDAHVGAGDPGGERRKVERLLTFLDAKITPSVRLFILGDLYDYWFEYKSVIPRAGFRLTAKLSEMARAGISIEYIGGNHDFWIEGGILEDSGIGFRNGPMEIELSGQSFFLAHGDTLWDHGMGQRIINGILRNRVNIRLYRLIHPDMGIGLARFASRLSRRKSGSFDYTGEDKYQRFAETQFTRGIRNVVFGHTHRPCFIKKDGHTYVNTGDWITHNTYGYFDGSALSLETWHG